ncbi:SPFH domain-containing protein [Streptomyces sp. NPDC060028]|uniref:SPFH domain-containing protein n=1 Tax=Streptomyces sp. NPDC060028 TaxID=3347041 RepID=UPI00368034E0
MYPTRTTSTTGILRVPPALPEPAALPAEPEPAAARAPEQPACDVPAARVESGAEPVHAPQAPGADIPHPFPHPHDEAAHADVATQRLRAPESVLAAEPAYGQRRPWPAVVRAGAEQHHRAGDEAALYVPEAPTAAPEPEPEPEPDPEPEPTAAAPAPAEGPEPWPEPVAVAVVPDPVVAPVADPVAPYVRDLPAPAPEPVAAEPAPAPEPAYAPPPTAPVVQRDGTPEPAGVPGPGVADIVARAVARVMEEDDDTQDLPAVGPGRGTAVTEVPVHLPFRAVAAPARPVPPVPPAPVRRPVVPRPAPGRRVPRGDDRLREHHGPVVPGWIGVAVGAIALSGCAAVLWRAGAVPAELVAAFGATPRAYQGLRAAHWPPLAFLGIVALLALGGLGRARTGHAWVLTLFGRYRGTVRRTGLTWVSPLLLRRRVDVRLRHWRSDPMPAVDSGGLALQVVVQVVWQVKDTARATLAVADHTEYLAEQVESAMARVLSQLPADAFHEDAPTLRDAEAVGDALTRMLAAETEAVGVEVYSAQPTRIEYAPEVAEAMRRRRVAAIDAKHRDTVLTSVVDAVDDTVHRLTSRGLVELDDYERKALVKDLTVAFYTGRAE